MRRQGAWLAALLPAAAGAGLAALIQLSQAPAPPPNVHFIVDSATLALAAGVALSAILLGAMAATTSIRRGREQAAAQARAEAAADRRRFLQRLDHELKNPLTAIQAGLALSAPGTDPDITIESRQEALASVEAQVKRVGRLTADLRKLAELDLRPIEHGPVDVAELLREVVEVSTNQAEAGGRRLALTLPQAPWPLPTVTGDQDLLLLAVHNLVDNAVKFSRSGDTLEVRAQEDGNSVVVEVADTGPGITPDELPHVWEELYRGQGARGVPGSGLGLALTRSIVERHGGRVAARSRPGQGTVFTVRLPIGSSR